MYGTSSQSFSLILVLVLALLSSLLFSFPLPPSTLGLFDTLTALSGPPSWQIARQICPRTQGRSGQEELEC